MQPSSKFYKDEGYALSFGELNENNKLHGRGIEICSNDAICIGYQENDKWITGHYIQIESDGEFYVGEYYWKDGRRRNRSTIYYTDGTEKKNGF